MPRTTAGAVAERVKRVVSEMGLAVLRALAQGVVGSQAMGTSSGVVPVNGSR